MRPVYTLTLVGVAAVVAAGTIWYYATRYPSIPEGATLLRLSCADCSPPASQANSKEPMPAIPTGSGLPCLVQFEVPGSAECESAGEALEATGSKLEGALDTLRIDAEEFPQAGTEWRLHIVPTHVLVSPEGEELWRHEGAVTQDELLEGVSGAVDASGSVES